MKLKTSCCSLKIENKLTRHDDNIALIFEYLKQLLDPPQIPRRKIGFIRNDEDE